MSARLLVSGRATLLIAGLVLGACGARTTVEQGSDTLTGVARPPDAAPGRGAHRPDASVSCMAAGGWLAAEGAVEPCNCPAGPPAARRCRAGVWTECACGPSAQRSLCGNGVVEPGELCDGGDLAGETCGSVTMFSATVGTLRCTAKCTFDTSGCFRSVGAGGSGGMAGAGGRGGGGGFAGGF